jgi:hypothetical protein
MSGNDAVVMGLLGRADGTLGDGSAGDIGLGLAPLVLAAEVVSFCQMSPLTI